MTKKRRPTDEPDDDALFKAVMRDVRPLAKTGGRQKREIPSAPRHDVKPPAEKRQKSGLKPTRKREAPPAPANAPGPGSGLDKRTAERLRRGKMAVDARIDLHGHVQADAHRALHAFIQAAYDRGDRKVLVITGKGAPRVRNEDGFMPDRETGVLKRNVPRWLNETPVRHMVLAVEPAQPRHGGGGALYVLLRRKR